MMHLNLDLILALSFLPRVFGAGNVISDYRVQSKDSAPVLGRGYSISTNSYHSQCIQYTDTTEPSYDYDFLFSQVTNNQQGEYDFGRELIESYGYTWLNSIVNSDQRHDSSVSVRSNHLVSLMSVDRYHASIDENSATIVDDALEMLTNSDLIGFFQVCGPGYIRTIRRTAEVTVVFTWTQVGQSYNAEYAEQVENGITSFNNENDSLSKFSQLSNTNVRVKAFGISLNSEDVGSLILTNIKDFSKVLDYAFRSMQNVNVGIVRSVEVLSWTTNPTFQANVEIDTVGSTNPSPMVRKYNLIANSEHIVRLDQNLRAQFSDVTVIQQCLGTILGLPPSYDNRYLTNHRCVLNERCMTKTVSELRCNLLGELAPSLRLTPRENAVDRYLYSRLFRSLSVFVSRYFGPCIQALSAEADGIPAGTMLVQHWTNVPECRDIACTFPNVHFNEESNSCVSGISDLESDDVHGITDQFCQPIYSNSNKPLSDECPDPPHRSDICEQTEDATVGESHHNVRYYENMNVPLGAMGDECNSCTDEILLQYNIKSLQFEEFKIAGIQRDGLVFPHEKKTCVKIMTLIDEELNVDIHRGTCDCDDPAPIRIAIDQTCRVSHDPNVCVILGPTNVVE